jgi:hypothetical protein
MGKIKQLFKQANTASRLEKCKLELNNAVETFKVQPFTCTSVHPNRFDAGYSYWVNTLANYTNKEGCKTAT